MSKNCCFSPADILLPRNGFEKWSVIACDQYTSEPEYWKSAEQFVGEAPSALKIILPEAYLEKDNQERIEKVNAKMLEYLSCDLLEKHENAMFYIERTQSDGKVRRGIIGKIDLECYDYRKGAASAIRATEETVLERIPPRVKIRENAPLELPHVMLLIDDPEKTVIEPIASNSKSFTAVYDFELMLGGGHIKGWKLDDSGCEAVVNALTRLEEENGGLLFCVGDGNHSLASAKACYEKEPNDKNRYALAEFVNIHDTALEFEPIYRVVFGAEPNALIDAFIKKSGGEYTGADAQKYTCIFGDCSHEISVAPHSKLCVGTLQSFLDGYIKEHPEVKIDYIHGIDSVKKLCSKDNAVGFIFEGMQKSELFGAVMGDGSLPRKTFSMGHADDKRFYLEARKIK